MNDLSKACITEANNSMQSAIHFLEKELEKIRAGKANPGMLDGVKIDYYGTPTEISQTANINTPDPRTIIIQPFSTPTWASRRATRATFCASSSRR